jgi:hypothetical protein
MLWLAMGTSLGTGNKIVLMYRHYKNMGVHMPIKFSVSQGLKIIDSKKKKLRKLVLLSYTIRTMIHCFFS